MDNNWIDHNACFDWYTELEKANLVLSFKGEFNHDLVKAILILTQQQQEAKGGPSRIFGVIVECLQNICKHGTSITNDPTLKSGIMLMGKLEGNYLIAVGNFIKKSKIPPLKAKLDMVNALDEDGLRKMQHNILINSSLSDEGNAGIGIIYMARKSVGPLQFMFQEVNNDISFFSMQLMVKS